MCVCHMPTLTYGIHTSSLSLIHTLFRSPLSHASSLSLSCTRTLTCSLSFTHTHMQIYGALQEAQIEYSLTLTHILNIDTYILNIDTYAHVHSLFLARSLSLSLSCALSHALALSLFLSRSLSTEVHDCFQNFQIPT